MRIMIVLFGAGLVALSLVMYDLKYDTRDLEARTAHLRAEIRDERDAIAVLRAEWSLLNRPDRIERLAREHLGLEPLPAQRLVTPDRLQLQVRLPTAGGDEAPRGAPAGIAQ